jgi:hypothetical protein
LRNKAGLESALARPETYARYQEADIALQATVLAHGIAEGQQYIDGNKRTALIAMLTLPGDQGVAHRGIRPRTCGLDTQFSAGATPEAVAKLLASAMHRTQ